MKSFLAALQFLTILPIPGSYDERTLGRSIPWFPLVGLVVGFFAMGTDWFLLRLGFPAEMRSLIAVAMLAVVTGGLHLDGLADTADGFLSARPCERVLEIMRDSHIGTMGVLALIFVLALKVSGLGALDGSIRLYSLLLAPLAGRCVQVLTMTALPYARREGGLAAVFLEHRHSAHGVWALVCLVGVPVWFLGLDGFWMTVGCLGVAVLFGYWCKQRINGITGDTLGAVSELTEAAVLVIVSMLYT